MKVFLTGATGFIGSRIVPELIDGGHQVLGLSRSDSGAEQLRAAGAEVHKGSLEDLDSLRSGAAQADAVIHCAFDHDFSNFVANCEKDRRAIEAMGGVLAGSGKLLLITSGIGMGSPGEGQLATENVFNIEHPNPRIKSELAGQEAAKQGVRVVVVRLPQVHDPVKQGLVTYVLQIMRQQGKCAYIGEGANRWAAAHVSDVARLYRLALEKEEAAVYHAVAEEGLSMREMVEVLADGLGLPVISLEPDQAEEYFGAMALFAGLDMPASSTWTRQQLNWTPTGPGLLTDLRAMNYAAV